MYKEIYIYHLFREKWKKKRLTITLTSTLSAKPIVAQKAAPNSPILKIYNDKLGSP